MAEPTPYQHMASQYLGAGWSPIPLPIKEKWPPPNRPHAYTGAGGHDVTEAEVRAWVKPRARVSSGNLTYPPGNIALRLPRTVLGIDVDAYGSKTGEATLARAEEEWGALPPTWVATSRTDGVSGIRLYRIPEGLAWPGELPTGKGVELIRWDHRFSIVFPSIHPEGRTYQWRTPEGELTEEEYPAPEDLAELPEAWVEGLTGGQRWRERSADESMGATEVRDWLAARVDPDAMCATMDATMKKWIGAIRRAGDDGGAHEAALDGAWALIGDAGAGHSGIHKALNKLRKAFLVAVAERRGSGKDGDRLAKEEWARLVVRGVQKVSAEGEPEEEDPCESLAKPKKKGTKGSDAIVWRLDDIGNAERLIRVADNRARYVEALGYWLVWDGSKWVPDNDRQMDRWAVKAVDTIEDDINYLQDDGDAAVVKAFKAHKKSSGTAGKLKAMVDVAKGRKGILLQPEQLDANPKLLTCAEGKTIELGREGIKVRPSWEDDFNTLSTGVAFNPKATNKLWDDFLERFQPDPEIREWVQKLVGYSLLGTNPKRLMVVCMGPTSTGKTTFGEALRNALGGYASEVNLSIFRDNQDERSRPDLVAALPKRIVVAEEVSAQWHMHPDQIKRLTGGSQISARLPHKGQYLQRVPAFTPWLMTNGAPTIEGADQALYRRVLVVPWVTQIPQSEEDGDVKAEMIETAREAILAWAVRGYEMWRSAAESLTEIPLSAFASNVEFREGLSDFDRFLAEACDRGDGHRELPSRLYEAYIVWCEKNGVPAKERLSHPKFGRELNGKEFYKKQARVDGQPTWFRLGISLNKEWARVI